MRPPADQVRPRRLRTARVLRVWEDACEVRSEGVVVTVPFAPPFPGPRVERVSPGHLVAVATSPDGAEVIVWRWHDAVVLGAAPGGGVLLWEPAHGEVAARPGASYQSSEPGDRAYASAGFPGADWWVEGPVTTGPDRAEVDLGAVERLFTDSGLWAVVFEP